MELRHLRYFIAAAEHKSVREASEHLHITQPAISRQIQDLESELGVRLLERSPRGLVLTRAGESYLRDVRKVMTALDEAAQSAQRIAAGKQGRLRLGYVENMGWDGMLPSTLHRFQIDVPDVRVELTALNSPEQLRAISDEILDGGFIYQYGALPDEFTAFPLACHDVVLAIPRAWGIDSDESLPLNIRLLADRPFVMLPRSAYVSYYDRLIGACQKCGVELNVVQEATTEAAILSLVCAGIGAAIVNSANLGRPPAQVQFFRLKDLSIPMPLAFVHRKGASNPILTRFLSLFQPG
ncbi:LysR family transcriptional regulator [Pseudomonas lijiangensis]|uniref:LysR family transcriptional regulator n=1 Tax=Pseudomonas syringae group TaxID=136849 RepID=UPI0018E5B462|nr:LysR family transcriptional regulator [Pseudomonas cichorii]MBI6853987.1 LysR family transcriptional regulator [Pseudomonas cichorii]